MTGIWLALMLAAQTRVPAEPASKNGPPQDRLVLVIDAVAASGRCATLAESPSSKVSPPPQIAPGPPPLLSFRYYEGRLRHRYGNLDLVVDDAGH